jgi:glycosyltransferase involved in cell wall biosynthesis
MSSVSIVLPTYNEVKSLEYVIESWSKYLKNRKIKHEFVVCEDGSTDGTKELVLKLMKKYPIFNEASKERRGYGGGVLAGIQSSKSDYILCIDSDGQCMPDSFDIFWRKKDKAQILIGIRSPRKDPLIRKIYSYLFFLLHKFLFRTNIKDPSCAYILAQKNIYIKLIPYLGFMKEGFWWGFTGAASELNIYIKEYKIRHYARYDGSTVVYKLQKMPVIIFRNILGLIKLKLYFVSKK